MLLCEAALGDCNPLIHANFNASSLPAGKMSTHGLGRMVPNPAEFVKMADGTVVPCGRLIQDPQAHQRSLQFNEYISYQVEHVRIRFLVVMRFKFK